MNYKQSLKSLKYAMTCLLALVYLVTIPQLSIAQITQFSQTLRFIPFNQNADEDDEGRGNVDTGSVDGTRGDCRRTEIAMLPLGGYGALNLTVNPHPTFWVYVPYHNQEVNFGVFVLQDKTGNYNIWETKFQLPAGTPGIVSISLPKTVPPLIKDETYRWYFDIDCPTETDPNQLTTPASVKGLIQLVSPSELENINQIESPIERIAIYTENGIWYDALTELMNLLRNDSEITETNLYEMWTDLLNDNDVNLSILEQEKIIGPVITE